VIGQFEIRCSVFGQPTRNLRYTIYDHTCVIRSDQSNYFYSGTSDWLKVLGNHELVCSSIASRQVSHELANAIANVVLTLNTISIQRLKVQGREVKVYLGEEISPVSRVCQEPSDLVCKHSHWLLEEIAKVREGGQCIFPPFEVPAFSFSPKTKMLPFSDNFGLELRPWST